MSATFDKTWMWHPFFSEQQPHTAGLFVHFKRQFTLDEEPPKSLKLHCSADTRYKLFVNQQLVAFGPVKGDRHLWFYDEVDIGPYLNRGFNHVALHVLRFFSATQYSPSFPRLPSGGARIAVPEGNSFWREQLSSSKLWDTSIDPFAILRVDEPEDVFLHVYEAHRRDGDRQLHWVSAESMAFKDSTGNAPPWIVSKRLIPNHRIEKAGFKDIYSLESSVDEQAWAATALRRRGSLCLPQGSKHIVELGVENHTTAFLRFQFERPKGPGSSITITYAESYEDEPDLYKGERKKAHRLDKSKTLLGPKDIYHLQSEGNSTALGYHENEQTDDIFMPFHWRTFRILKLDITVGASDLIFKGIDMNTISYPLDVQASFEASPRSDLVDSLWATSVRTLTNCMHDCYEDCPFYEQLQYAMDTRSSCLFTYCVSGDGRLARQAIIQLFNTFHPGIGLTNSRAPTNKQQYIPHFSLYWICMLADYHDYFDDKPFLKRFIAVADAVLSYFDALIDPTFQLVKSEYRPGIWNFVDWAVPWKPYGIPNAAQRTGFSTFTNELYAYTLKTAAAAKLLISLGRPSLSEEYLLRADIIVASVRQHCFDGEFFTDSLATEQGDSSITHSQHSQIWAVLSGVSSGVEAQNLLRRSLSTAKEGVFAKASIAMSFYTMRALSVAGGGVYEEHYHQFWEPWQRQLDLGLTTWWEDDVAQRSDCHAWGSVPLYDFPAEVAGIRPAKPGWAAIEFRPRLSLYRDLKATVPLSMNDGTPTGTVKVSWTTIPGLEDVIEVHLRVDANDSRKIPIHIRLPGIECTLTANGTDLIFRVLGCKSPCI